WMPAFPFLIGLIFWLACLRWAILRYELLPSRLIRYRALFALNPVPTVMADSRGRIVHLNPAAVALLGEGQTTLSALVPDRLKEQAMARYRALFANRSAITSWEVELESEDVLRSVVVDADTIVVGGRLYSILVLRDATASKRERDRLRHLAYHDPLTGLHNVAQIRQQLDEAVRHGLAGLSGFAVLLLDLDNFKALNDTWGHQAGDDALVETARRLCRHQRPSDMVGRLGGDEFVILVDGLSAPEQVMTLAERVQQEFVEPVVTEAGQTFRLQISMGISLFPDHAMDAKSLLRAADRALYAAKEMGKGGIVLFGADEDLRLERVNG
ncbi:MAG: diguanylate cyclase, partial [Terriglobales bacterium]